MAHVEIEHFTDPNCPFAYSSEPVRQRLRWVFGDQLSWRTRMVVLSRSSAEYAAKGLTVENVAKTYERLSRDPGMPFVTEPRSHLPATEPACAAVVAVRERAGADAADRLLRALQLAQMGGSVIDEPAALDAAIETAGLTPATVHAWAAEPEARAALEADMDAARHPLPAAAALDRRLADWEGGRRYTCPTYVLHHSGGTTSVVAGFNPIEVYEVVFANCGPTLAQRPDPVTMCEVLAWAGEPLATAEVAAVANIGREKARDRLVEEGARAQPFGTDVFWERP
jgi:2-hydroxychromene-2-carboxylate isomerase